MKQPTIRIFSKRHKVKSIEFDRDGSINKIVYWFDERQSRTVFRKDTIIDKSLTTERKIKEPTQHPWHGFAYAPDLNELIATNPNRKDEKQVAECDWCGDLAEKLSHPHTFDMAIGKKMCRGCWDHDREVYQGSYGEDIGEFKPIGTEDDKQ